jgi:iron complex transport system permease protein
VLSKPLRVLSLGNQTARAVGLDVVAIQWSALATAVLLCGAAVSISGLVGFVGLIAPYVSRRLFGNDERWQITSCALVGGLLVLVSDLVARTLAHGQELPLGTLLALLGAPFFLALILRQRSEGW